MNTILQLLQTANFEYNCGNFPSAKKHTEEVISAFESMQLTPDSPNAMSYLEALTLAQSIATKNHDLSAYEKYEDSLKTWMLLLLGDYAMSYYGLHLTDAAQCYLHAGDISMASHLLLKGISIMEKENGVCNLITFINLYHTSQIHFRLNRYHECINTCIEADNLLLSDTMIPEDATPFLQHLMSDIQRLADSNCITAACAYEKINSPQAGIEIITNLLNRAEDNLYTKASAEITLAQLYSRAGNYDEAKIIYNKYKNSVLLSYGDVAMAMSILSMVLESPQNITQPLFAPEFDGQLSASSCYSKDAFEILLYNNGLKLIGAKQYSQALTLYSQLGDKGLALRLYLLAQTGNYSSIPEVKKKADAYFDREIRSLFLYYNEYLVHNHLSLLEYHFSLCMDAYLSCHENLGEQALPAKDIYNFLLNTKNISMEATYLSRIYQSLETLNNRKTFKIEEIYERLTPDDILLEYCITRTITENFYCVFLITCDQTVCIRLEKQSVIDSLITKWNSLMLSSAHASVMDYESATHNRKETDSLLRRYLYRPIREYLEHKNVQHVIVSPSGNLAQFPFACLPVSSSACLGDKYEITYVNTAKELITNPPMQSPLLDSSLIIGAPTFEHFTPLPYAKEEAMTAAACLNTLCYTDEAARIDLFEDCFEHAPNIIHIATHGIFHEMEESAENIDWNAAYEVMEHSGLVLANDLPLSCNMISAMNFSDTYLTVLSACQTGNGVFHSSEGIYGLRRAFRLAGCHSMIVSLWQIDDKCTALFMKQFYEYMTQNSCTAKEAFFFAINVLRNYKENNITIYTHPYYWAGYIFIE